MKDASPAQRDAALARERAAVADLFRALGG